MRLFVAVNFDDAVRDTIRAALDDFPVENPPWRWSAPATWHVTMKFLGDTSPPDAQRAQLALDEVRSLHRAFAMTLGRFGAFPTLRDPRVLFYRVESGADALASLAGDVDRVLHRAMCIEPERRPFFAHVTVARVRESLAPAVVARLADVVPLVHPAVRVDSFQLMESQLGPDGARHRAVKEFRLGAPV